MEEVSIIGVDIAKHVFQVHGARSDGSVAFSKKLSRSKLLPFLASQPRCVVAMEACASSHFWGREIEGLGHKVRLIAPAYVKPFVKRQKNDVADAEAIAEAAGRPTSDALRCGEECREAVGGHGAPGPGPPGSATDAGNQRAAWSPAGVRHHRSSRCLSRRSIGCGSGEHAGEPAGRCRGDEQLAVSACRRPRRANRWPRPTDPEPGAPGCCSAAPDGHTRDRADLCHCA